MVMDSERQPSTPESLRVLILNQPFAPDVVATAQIAKDFADACVAQGHHVTAIASRSLYGQKGATLPRREMLDGIRVIRVGSNYFGKRFIFGRVFDFMLYFLHVLWRGVFGKRYDVVVCLTTPPYIAMAGIIIGKVRGSRVVYWLMDIYPDVMVAHGMIRSEGLLHRLLRRLHRGVLAQVDSTVVLGRCMEERLLAQGASASKISVIPVWGVAAQNSTDQSRQTNPYRDQWNVGDRCLVMYSGNFGLAHDIQTFLDAAIKLRSDDGIRFVFVGGGKRKPVVEACIEEHGLTNCVVAPYQPRERLASLLEAADVHLVTMEAKWWGLVVPSKFFGVAAIGRPVLFVGPAQSEIARSINEADCGSVVEPGGVEELCSRIEEYSGNVALREEHGRLSREKLAAVASKKMCLERLLELVTSDSPHEKCVPADGEIETTA
jgi:putative colanic acid biosynthesis glycosyltransferase WcaI